MTIEELNKVRFKMVSHISMEKEHCISYMSEDGRLGFCDFTRKKKDGTFGKSHRHYRIDNKIYETKEAFLEAIKDFNPNIIPIKQ